MGRPREDNRLLNDKREILQNLASNLRNYRRHRSLTQEACADMANVSMKYWQELESMRNTKCPSSLVALKIARIMDINVEDLFRKA